MGVAAMLCNEMGTEECRGGTSTDSKRAHEPVVTMEVFMVVGREVRGRSEREK